jgi:hypothetical protein
VVKHLIPDVGLLLISSQQRILYHKLSQE